MMILKQQPQTLSQQLHQAFQLLQHTIRQSTTTLDRFHDHVTHSDTTFLIDTFVLPLAAQLPLLALRYAAYLTVLYEASHEPNAVAIFAGLPVYPDASQDTWRGLWNPWAVVREWMKRSPKASSDWSWLAELSYSYVYFDDGTGNSRSVFDHAALWTAGFMEAPLLRSADYPASVRATLDPQSITALVRCSTELRGAIRNRAQPLEKG